MSTTSPATQRRTAAAHVGVADRLTAAGFDVSTLDGGEVNGQTSGAVAKTMPDGTVLAGAMYMLDFTSEEERGAGELRTALAGTDPRNVAQTAHGRTCAARFADVNALVMSSRSLPTRTYAWGEDLTTGHEHTAAYVPEYASSYARSLPYARQDTFAQKVLHGQVTMEQLRTKAKNLGLSPLPRTKAALADLVLNSAQYNASRILPDVWPAWFAQGQHLVLRADSGPLSVVIDALGDAIDAGTLAVGTFSGAFCSGLFLYDARDETRQIVADRVAAADWHDQRMTELAPVADELRAAGHRWFFLGNPSLLSRAQDEGAQVVRYWLNGYSGGVTRDGVTCRKQPFGWYSLAELLNEDFIRDAAATEAAEAARPVKRPARV